MGTGADMTASPEVHAAATNVAAGEMPRAAVNSVSYLPWAATAVAFGVLFAKPIYLLAKDWWTMPEAGHGLLLAPVAIWMAWRSGIDPEAKPNRTLGVTLLLLAVVV